MAILSTDPLDIRLNADGDIDVDPINGITFVSGLEGVAQLVKIAVRLYLGEWVYDEEAGVAYFQRLLGEKFNREAMIDEYTRVILDVPCVLRISSLSVTFDALTRKAEVTGTVVSTFGDIELDEEVP